MITKRINIWREGEYNYPLACGFQPNLHTYFFDDAETRPCVLVVPGGGYNYCSEAEGELVAHAFNAKGYHAAVLTYTTDVLFMEPLHDQPLKDISRAVRLLRSQSAAYSIDPDELIICGFSAGAHLSGSLGEFYDLIEDPIYQDISSAPDRLVLCYPVITSGVYAHRHSFDALFGTDAPQEKRDTMSLEKHVRDDMCPVFLWQTAQDESVPVENSILMALALRAKKIPVELHIFQNGPHGLSVATKDWEDHNCGELYTLEQVFAIQEAIQNGTLIPADRAYAEEMRIKFEERKHPMPKDPKRTANKEAAVWVDLCDAWLARNR